MKRNPIMEQHGAGIWYSLHQDAKAEDRSAVLRRISTLPCEECRQHAESYLSRHPLPASDDKLFEWSVVFHNNVNSFLRKPVISLVQAQEFHSRVCQICGVSEGSHVSKIEKAEVPSTVGLTTVKHHYVQPLILESRSGPKSILKHSTYDSGRHRSRHGR